MVWIVTEPQGQQPLAPIHGIRNRLVVSMGITQGLLRLLPAVERLVVANEELEGERESLMGQRTVLALERDELRLHTERLSAELNTANDQANGLAAEIVRLLDQRDVLESERDELSGHLQRIRSEASSSEARWRTERERLRGEFETCQLELAETRTAWAADHKRLEQEVEVLRARLGGPGASFYSPIVDPDESHVLEICANEGERLLKPCQDVIIDESRMLETFHRIARHYQRLPFPALRQPSRRYYFENPNFSYSDAITLFGILCETRPRRLVEVGVGFSSLASMDTNDLRVRWRHRDDVSRSRPGPSA